jgi:hypothetical protein
MLTWRDLPNKISVKTVSVSASGNSPAHDDLKLPSGKTVRETDTDSLRRELSQFEIEGVYTRPRAEIVADYASILQKIFDEAGHRALAELLEKKSKCTT